MKSLVKTYVVFWNDGTKTLNGNDVAEADPIRLVMDDRESRILRTRMVRTTRDVNRASVAHAGTGWTTQAALVFSFLDPGDGFVVEILHTGEDAEVQVKGTIKGFPKGLSTVGFVKPITMLEGASSHRGLKVSFKFPKFFLIPAGVIGLGGLAALFLPQSFFLTSPWRLLIKTTSGRLAEIEAYIKANHSYETPMIAAMEFSGGSREYLDWISAETRAGT